MEEFRTLNYDPIHALYLRKKQPAEQELPKVEPHNKSDVDALQEFCKRHGIIGMNFGHMSPRAALSMLRSRFGETTNFVKKEKVLLKG
jgi:hypothetical protein